jgi:hypothetical protein
MKQNGLYRLEGYTLDKWIDILRTVLYNSCTCGEIDNINNDIKEMFAEIEALEPTVMHINKWD